MCHTHTCITGEIQEKRGKAIFFYDKAAEEAALSIVVESGEIIIVVIMLMRRYRVSTWRGYGYYCPLFFLPMQY